MGENGAIHLIKSKWPNLKEINLCSKILKLVYNQIKISGFETIAVANNWVKLKHLHTKDYF